MSAKVQLTESSGTSRILRSVAVGVGIGAAVCVVILLLFSILLSGRTIPQSVIDPMAIFAMSMGAFFSGLVCAKIIHKNGLMCGLFCGGMFSVIILACSFTVPGSELGFGAVIKIMFMLFSAMLGGVLGVNTRMRKK